jgi:formamidopyrimidine-DNA glycosylase
MPELPEVETVRRSVLGNLAGARVTAVEVGRARLRTAIDGEALRETLPGTILDGAERHGKYLGFHFGSLALVVHLGMSGRLEVVGAGDQRLAHAHVIVSFEGARELRFVDPRRFGMVEMVSWDNLHEHRSLARLGPDALDTAAQEALQAAHRSKVPIHALLLDQSVVAGIGNIYASETLFRSGVRPGRRVATVSATRLGAVAAAAREVLADAIAAGGTTLPDGGFVDAVGVEGYFAVKLYVYGRGGEPCRQCGATIRRSTLRGRSVYFCPVCQR